MNYMFRNGWAATIVDTLTTTALMGLEEEFKLVIFPTNQTKTWNLETD